MYKILLVKQCPVAVLFCEIKKIYLLIKNIHQEKNVNEIR
jgi:hypothetical protein